MQHEDFMRLAIAEAKKAEALGEVPIGAIVVKDGQVIGRGYNLREQSNDATSHAEMQAIREANAYLDNWRLMDCDMYVTLEPCPMCSGAIILSRIRHLYFGAYDPKGGTVGSLMNLVTDERFNHQVEVTSGLLGRACSEMLTSFFRELRKQRKRASRKPRKEENNLH
ncbi:tRNA adenosine(34) deaminase TadA [Aerococcus sanguinicola]|uniref:tRNA adenosine(34) deaminase TadA n=1 Tax=unclassified Aerococcus TaxID=2618060 RepID=UPI000A9BFEFA|nr:MULTISPECIES: tRNA adenosine(34) deaminase TadA [unclassified Aerococcus]MDK6233236.1 tRNA adenosine(34) deaminase TadA [Aerococcus sp. UMB10185]MDK6804654.1 tRNA adenosine(34) deaminase TadA [Aerococcus sp. UMB7834]MDK6856073.1 tRNA adenosine(34) deaminase TadA [Aerococcus sp. UMB7533]MDK8503035.1 tRNA adenosine(34) deaminase TadA [Aerococcus sp. UMB1112A]